MDKKVKGIIIIAFALLLPVIIIANYDAVKAYDWSSLGYVGIFIVMFLTSATVILPLPGLAVATVAGAVANPILIGISGGIGSALGEIIGYLTGYGGSQIINGNNVKEYEKIRKMLTEKDRTFIMLFLFSLIPNPLFDVAGIIAGSIKYPAWKFFLACALGKIIKITIFAYLGYLTISSFLF